MTGARAAALAARRIPGESGLWIFILSDLLLFGFLFAMVIHDFAAQRAVFLAAQGALNRTSGLINTLLLLTSSWLVVLGVESARDHLWRRASGFIACGIIGGAGFLLVKGIEYAELIRQGYSLISNGFFTYYFVITGLHLAHVLIGLVWLAILWQGARRPGGWKNAAVLESAGCYWHMVDLLWIGIFAVVYLLR